MGPETGLFGKLPAHGDFVRRGLPRSFTAPWDDWLSAGIEAARAGLGDGFEAAWEAAPVWRFRLSPGACGPAAAVGVIGTSRDMVGRRFPLTLAAILPGAALPPPDAWYEALEGALGRACREELDADALAAMLPPPPADDSDATLDGRSLFWGPGLPARGMPAASEFGRLLEVVPPAREAGGARPGLEAAIAAAPEGGSARVPPEAAPGATTGAAPGSPPDTPFGAAPGTPQVLLPFAPPDAADDSPDTLPPPAGGPAS